MIGFNPATGEGFVLLSNGESDLTALASELYQAMPALGWG
jgi:hypothetical protein